MKKKTSLVGKLTTAFFVILCLVWVFPVIEVVINSFKNNNAINLDAFALPTADTFVGWANYINGMTFGN